MKKSRIILYISGIVLLLVMGFNACTRAIYNTSTENPSGTSTLGNPYAPNGQKLASAICEVISKCHPQAAASCANGILDTPGFAASLNISTQNFDTLASVIQGEQAGELLGNINTSNQCESEIQSLNCADASVQGAFDASQAYPFLGSTSLVQGNSCNQIYTELVDLEVPIEMVDFGLASKTTAMTFLRTQTSLDANDYDGQKTFYLDLVATNADNQPRSVFLVNAQDQVVGSLSVPAMLNVATRFRAAFSNPIIGADVYRLRLDGTTVANQLNVYSGRIVVNQLGATKTKIFIPMAGVNSSSTSSADDVAASVDVTLSSNYQQNRHHNYGQWIKDVSAYSSLAPANPFTLEVVMSSAAGSDTVYATLYNADLGAQVSGSELSTTSTAPALLQASFSESATNFSDLSKYEVRIRRTDAINGALYRAGLWIKVVNLRHAEIFYRYSMAFSRYFSPSNTREETQLALINSSAFNQTISFYNESTGWVTQAGTPCGIQVVELGISDVANIPGFIVPNSLISFSSVNKNVVRSGPISLSPDSRVTAEMLQTMGPGECWSPHPHLVVKF